MTCTFRIRLGYNSLEFPSQRSLNFVIYCINVTGQGNRLPTAEKQKMVLPCPP
ncbi:hypothetical protein BABINDRAFT_83122 [Babjeviella inositovora NRRL Y-12698]|uniref:Uncharacterized protein n=1 Tax=Babjeviella inositovora NRRL Y-12698 TaxID=984486 RepID=A0A1E3QL86_9ASCO|nr:uncharacterized protein BABINDRAFT_83122 [Babjeviella inositovora NRRL Y-12698]ODQ78378.1 hypothetical protein BABINDRAFT_83122 [Babjeviella inositovora NRRL Y-12698]